MKHPYSHVISPLKIGNVVIKNRLMMTKAISQELQGPESFPAESTIKYCADAAKNGAAIVTCTPGAFPEVRGGRFASIIETENRRVQSYYGKMIDRIHAYGSLASASMQSFMPEKYNISDVRDPDLIPKVHHGPPPSEPVPEMTKEGIAEFIEMFTRHCVYLKNIGFDMINVYMCYNACMLAKTMSPLYNQRTDEYGGSIENRARLVKELFTAIKEACGPDFLIEAQMSYDEPGGYTMDDLIEFLRQWEGLIDIVQIRTGDSGLTHPTTYSMVKEAPHTLKASEAVKKAGIKVITCPVGGFQSLELMESFIAEGKCDMIGMGRGFICDPELGKKMYAGKGEDVRPCLRCDKCHGAVCSMNPKMGLAHVWDDMFEAPEKVKKVAVIGGGPSGMQAAITAADRGHQVVLFEKADKLGGQLLHADYIPAKWAVKDVKDYLIRQVEKRPIEVRLNTEATAADIEAMDFDAVIAGCGSVPAEVPVEGGCAEYVWSPMTVFGHEAELGKKVVIVGGTIMCCDAALYLAQHGHEVTVITRNRMMAHDHVTHGRDGTMDYLYSVPGITYITEGTTTLVEKNGITYTDKDGNSIRLEADSIVFHAGRKALVDEAFAFAGIAPEFKIVGDCNRQLNDLWLFHDLEPKARKVEPDIRQSIYTGYTAAMSI